MLSVLTIKVSYNYIDNILLKIEKFKSYNDSNSFPPFTSIWGISDNGRKILLFNKN